ncbi:hypothetical protein DRO32_00185, partial [Candidatus Bathyarchaeota archaeon]
MPSAGGRLEEKMSRLVERYHELLFTLPSMGKLMAFLLLASSALGLGLGAPLAHAPAARPPLMLLSAAGLMVMASLAIWALDSLLLRGDPIITPRRCLGLELFSLAVLTPMSILGGLLSYCFGPGSGPGLALRTASVGASLSLSARSLVLATASLAGRRRSAACVLSGPLVWLSSAYCLASLSGLPPSTGDLLLTVACLSVGSLTALAFIMAIDRSVKDLFEVGTLRIARGFSACWIADHNGPLEEFLDEIGVEAEVGAYLLLFEGPGGHPIGALVVPGVHPGPFRGVGSSPLPGLIQEALEEALGCPVAVPHGLSGHDMNLTSRRECQKLIRALLASLDRLAGPIEEARPAMRSGGPLAKALCQVFGPLALLILTAAPEPMEDLPVEIGPAVREEARALGLADAVLVDAHNCLDGLGEHEDLVGQFVAASSRALEVALRSSPTSFRAGMAKVVPADFSVEEGMGPGGITVLAVEAGGQKNAYVVLDGNNMVVGLREHLLRELGEMGFPEAEVTTSDTHVVNARLLIERGYHPVGEAMDWDLLA